ncbi:MAG: response regulator transcription factor [Saprospiraceae bacterium]|nr:response regulator transcription factor [Saprospiraceae bacterium]
MADVTEKKKIIILDDHLVIMQGVKQLLSQRPDFEVASMVTSVSQLLEELAVPFDILMLDLNLKGKNSLDHLADIRSKQPRLKVLIFSSYHTPSTVKRALQGKVNGYLLKDVDQQGLVEALQIISSGKIYLDPRLPLDPHMKSERLDQVFEDDFIKQSALTAREAEIMQAIVDGLDNQGIAAQLFISPHTVQTHRKKLFKKLGVHSAAELIKFVLKQRQG